MARLLFDLRNAVRLLRCARGFSAAAVGVLALGIGTVTIVFILVNAVLLRPLPFADASRLVMIEESAPARGVDAVGLAYQNFLDLRANQQTLADVAVFSEMTASLADEGVPERVDGALVSHTLFDTLGVQPQFGRTLTAEDDRTGTAPVAILSHELWTGRYLGARDIVGRTIVNEAQRLEVIGIMPPGFRFPETAELWVPLGPVLGDRVTRDDHFLGTVGRIAPGGSLGQARADLDRIGSALRQQFPASNRDVSFRVTPLRERLTSDYRPALTLLAAAVACVLLIACANLTNLWLARTTARDRELVVRRALGATHVDLVRLVLAEHLLIAALGATVGAALAAAGVRAILALVPVRLPFWLTVEPDWRVGIFVVALGLTTAFVVTLACAWQISAPDLARALRAGAHTMVTGRRRTRRTLVLIEVALSVSVVFTAVLLVQTFVNLARVPLGFDPAPVTTFRVALPRTTYDTPERRMAFVDRLREALVATPGIARAAVTSNLPLGGAWRVPLSLPGDDDASVGKRLVHHAVVTPGYFSAMGARLEQGRDFDASDGPREPVVVVNRAFVTAFHRFDDPIGQRVRLGQADDPWRRIIGVASDMRQSSLRADVVAAAFIPFSEQSDIGLSVVVRSSLAPLALSRALRAVVAAVDPTLPLSAIRPMDTIVRDELWQTRVQTVLIAVFAGLSLAMMAVGLYAVLAYETARRTREIGLRLALGATPAGVVRLVAGQGSRLVAAGLAAGMAIAVPLAAASRALLFDVQITSLVPLAVVAGTVSATAMLAVYLPARRAARCDPLDALRAE